MEEWDEEAYGEPPDEDSAAWADVDELMGECACVYQDVALLVPDAGFFEEPLPSPPPAAGEREEVRQMPVQRLPLAQLLAAAPECTRFRRVRTGALYPDPPPSEWQFTTCWKGNVGSCEIEVAEALTLRELLRAHPISATLGVNGRGDHLSATARVEGEGLDEGAAALQLHSAALHTDDLHTDDDLHFEELHVGDETIEWENGRSKSSDFELTPPDNVRLWRRASFGIGALVCLLRRASERVYAPGGVGVDGLRREFEALQAGQQASGEGECEESSH